MVTGLFGKRLFAARERIQTELDHFCVIGFEDIHSEAIRLRTKKRGDPATDREVTRSRSPTKKRSGPVVDNETMGLFCDNGQRQSHSPELKGCGLIPRNEERWYGFR